MRMVSSSIGLCLSSNREIHKYDDDWLIDDDDGGGGGVSVGVGGGGGDPGGGQQSMYDNAECVTAVAGDNDELNQDVADTRTNKQTASCRGICARALYDYQASEDNEITFDPDDITTNIDKVCGLEMHRMERVACSPPISSRSSIDFPDITASPSP